MGLVAAGAGLGAVKDNVIHTRRAHGFGRIGPHDPAYGFQKVGFPAAIWPHNPGQAGLNVEISRLDEGFKSRQLYLIENQRPHKSYSAVSSASVSFSGTGSPRIGSITSSMDSSV